MTYACRSSWRVMIATCGSTLYPLYEARILNLSRLSCDDDRRQMVMEFNRPSRHLTH